MNIALICFSLNYIPIMRSHIWLVHLDRAISDVTVSLPVMRKHARFPSPQMHSCTRRLKCLQGWEMREILEPKV